MGGFKKAVETAVFLTFLAGATGQLPKIVGGTNTTTSLTKGFAVVNLGQRASVACLQVRKISIFSGRTVT
jgi:hypothetical protein